VSDLLAPSLSEAPRRPIFSMNAMIAAAFFGGAFAVPLLAMENSRRLTRLPRDAAFLVLALLGAAAVLLFTLQAVDISEFRKEFRLLSRALGFAYVGGYYWLHRETYRSLKILGIEPASPWLAVLASVLLSLAITILLLNTAA
jgi:lipid-A-disaccharide synthase-like uncharacterized protein